MEKYVMGLDMYLRRGNSKMIEAYRSLTEEQKDRCEFSPYEEVGYWRKANHIRQWFVDKCGYPQDGNCEEVEVTKEELEELAETCKYVLEHKEEAPALMPTCPGFFFGSTDYDDWYFGNLEDTLAICLKVIEETDWDNEIVLYSDWW